MDEFFDIHVIEVDENDLAAIENWLREQGYYYTTERSNS